MKPPALQPVECSQRYCSQPVPVGTTIVRNPSLKRPVRRKVIVHLVVDRKILQHMESFARCYSFVGRSWRKTQENHIRIVPCHSYSCLARNERTDGKSKNERFLTSKKGGNILQGKPNHAQWAKGSFEYAKPFPVVLSGGTVRPSSPHRMGGNHFPGIFT